MPVYVYVQESEDLKVWADTDKDELIKHGFDWEIAESIPGCAGACREAQSIWAREFKSQEEAEKEWLRRSPEAFGLRDMVLEAMRYAFRKEPQLLAKVAAIADGNSREDMIQDLNDAAVLGRANTAQLEAINFDLAKLDLAAETSDQMAVLLAAAKGEKGTVSKELDMRNRAYTYLKKAVDELRACGKYAFAHNEERLKGYRSEYLRKKNKNNRKNNDETGTAEE